VQLQHGAAMIVLRGVFLAKRALISENIYTLIDHGGFSLVSDMFGADQND